MKLKDLEMTAQQTQEALLRDTRADISSAVECIENADFEGAEQRLADALLKLGEHRGIGNLLVDLVEGP